MAARKRPTPAIRGIFGKRLTHTQAREADAELKKIEAKHGRVTPKLIVDWARPASNPLHKHFEWDKTKAHEKFLLDQAQRLIREVQVVIVNLKRKPIRVRAWVSTVDRLGRHYSPIIPVLSKKETRRQLLAEALEQLNHLRRRYEMLSELAEVFEAIDRAAKKKAA